MEINDPRIEAYFNFELSAEEAAAFLEEAKKSPALWREIQFRQWMIDGIQDEGKIELKEFISNRLAEEREESTGKFWYAAAAIAITVVVGFGIAWPYLNKTNENSLSEYAADSSYRKEASKSEESTAALQQNRSGYTVNADTTNSTIAMNSDEMQTPMDGNSEATDDRVYSIQEGPGEGAAATDIENPTNKWDNGDNQIENKRSVPAENDAIASYRKRSNYFGTDVPAAATILDKEIVQIASFQVVPIDPVREVTKTDNYKRADAINSVSVAKSKSKLPAALSNQQASNANTPASNAAADTVNYKIARENNNLNRSKNSAVVKDNFTVVLTRSDNGKPTATTQKDAKAVGNHYTIILNNFGDANALLYRLGNTYYLGVDTYYYQIDFTPGKVWTPQKVTNKAILEQLNP